MSAERVEHIKGATNEELADYIRDQVCCPRIHGCELGGSPECPAERVRAALSTPKTPSQGREEIARIIHPVAFEDTSDRYAGYRRLAIAKADLILAALSAPPSPEGVLKGKQGDRASVADGSGDALVGASDTPCKSEGGAS